MMRPASPILPRAFLGLPLGACGLLLAVVAGWSGPQPAQAAGTDALTRALLENPPEVDWRTLGGLDYRTGETTPDLDALDGKVIKIAGFTVPFEDWMTTASEFLLVPYAGACVHTPPPPPHQLVYVEMDRERRASINLQAPFWVEGILQIDMMDSVYGQAGFRLVGHRVYPYQY